MTVLQTFLCKDEGIIAVFMMPNTRRHTHRDYAILRGIALQADSAVLLTGRGQDIERCSELGDRAGTLFEAIGTGNFFFCLGTILSSQSVESLVPWLLRESSLRREESDDQVHRLWSTWKRVGAVTRKEGHADFGGGWPAMLLL
eukprot:6175525-Pleurochrysis_carterae.AAC.1